MIKKLRFKFILVSMLSIILVLVVIMTSIGSVNYYKLVSEADSKIELINSNVKEDINRPNIGNAPTSFSAPSSFDENNNNPFPGDKGMQEARYFCVYILEDGTYKFNDSHIASVSESEASVMAQNILSSSKTKGFKDVYRYQVFSDIEETISEVVITEGVESQNTYKATSKIIFLDCRESISSFKNFVITISWVSAVGLVAFFILVFLLSIKVFKPVKASIEKQKRFITNASHELKTPLTIISANNEVLELEYGENEYSDSIDKQIKRLSQMISNLTLLSKLDETNKIETKECNLTSLVYEAIDSFSNVYKANKKEFSYNISDDVYANCDSKLISQLIYLVLDNANKYSISYVKLNLLKSSKGAEFYIENDADVKDGEGSLYLERFYRSSEARKSKEGSGIGLSLVNEIVNLHKGSIKIEAENKKFSILIRLK